MLHDKMTKEELLTLALFDNGGIDDTDLYRDTTDSTYESVKTLSNCGAFPMLSLTAEINAVQDLHGYDRPWAGGAGKNKLPLDLDTIKSLNTSGTWSGNVYTYRGVTFNVATDNGGNVTKITVNGTASAWCALALVTYTPSIGDYILSNTSSVPNGQYLTMSDGGFVGGGTSSVNISITESASHTVYIGVDSDTSVSNKVYEPMLHLSTETDATFAPYSNICPISGWDEAVISVSPLNIAPLYNGQIYGDGRWISSDMRLTNVSSGQDNSYFLKAGTYTLDYDKLNSNAPSLLQCSALTKDDSYTIIDNFATAWNSLPFTFTLTQDGYLYFTIRKDADTTLNVDDYKAKVVKNTYTIDLDGTRYGGKLDLVNGVMTVDRAMVDLGTLNWTYESSIFRLNQSIGAKLTTDTSAVANMLCSIYKTVSQNAMGSTSTDHCIAGLNWSNGVRVKDSNYTTVADFKTAMNGVQLVYELATPLTIQLTPTQVKLLLGVNNLWANSGDVGDARYFRKVEL